MLRPIPGAPIEAPNPDFPDMTALSPQAEKEARWLARIEDGYPPRRQQIALSNPKRGSPTHTWASPDNDPMVIRFLTDMLGPMVSAETAHRLSRFGLGYSCYGGELDARAQAAYGSVHCVWAAADETWWVYYQRDELELHCPRKPTDADLRRLCFVIGWWTMRTETYALRGEWRRMRVSNTGATMRGAVVRP